MKVQLIAKTEMAAEIDGVPWETESSWPGGTDLAEFAGRACYQSWSRPNPATATNEGYVNHILEVGHLSVLEHATATFYITGVSRSLTHELVRHRHLSPSQLSQRYVPEGTGDEVVPAVIAADPELLEIFERANDASRLAYIELSEKLEAKYAGIQSNKTAVKKLIRQTARSVLPNAAETKITMTGNYRAWRHFIDLRATPNADVEIRALAVEILRKLQQDDSSANAFADYRIAPYTDVAGMPETETAASPYGHNS